ncbi:MAG TPA: tRNA (adenosine(37)-N6)-threonylcarbamoyltransferase complex ATPase subunit type 1 TsaE [candidate division Zixibacteria bacterium]|nr:tRNA (adenosine(37)-N6)-threonylcarbamoyltransferase complex ATPase subunit type 1 TsaE [candidate division Zixibacteria bacterium]HER00390.1 tRNA (adenosine(37)-N6)-threonylcarbamoyltransferase complex ATPase subunit type 1 TsaE [candidate division Zixibacteria bacterium]
MEPISFLSDSEQKTQELAEDFARELQKGSLVALTGQLGAGKTVFARGLCRGLGFEGIVSSPSYTLVNIYKGRFRINHVDLYRIENTDEIADLDPDELFYPEGVTIIEWAEKIKQMLPARKWIIYLELAGKNKRRIEIFDSVWPDKIG